MSFVQIVSFSTTRLDEFGRLHDEWLTATEGDEGPSFTDLQLVDARPDLRAQLADGLARYLETNEETPGLFAADLIVEMNVPLWRFQLAGPTAMTELLSGDAPYGRRFEELSWCAVPGGFLQQWAWRTTGGDGYESHYSRGVSIVELAGTRIGRITVHCSGDWDPATEQRQLREAPMVDAPQPALS